MTKRRSRRRRDDRDALTLAWDEGLPPPPEALMPEHREQAIECLFFRWADDHARYRGPEHPHYRAWALALRAGSASATQAKEARANRG